jgi:CRP-like cAMP-binding protein
MKVSPHDFRMSIRRNREQSPVNILPSSSHFDMIHQPILANISRPISLDPEEAGYFTSLLEYQEISRKTLLLKKGRPCKNIAFVHSGALRAFYRGENGKEATVPAQE